MAHFVDGKTFSRVSGQRLHVSVLGTMRLGLWGGYEYNGKPLKVESTSPQVLRLRPLPARGDLRMFELIGADLGDSVVRAVDGGGAAWDSVHGHVHRIRKTWLPAFDDLLRTYPGDEESSDAFRKRVGGQVDNSQFSNTCTLRLSEAFNETGHPIPHGQAGLATVKGGDNRFYALRVAEFKKYMLQTYGAPDMVRRPPSGAAAGVSRRDFTNLRGVICFEARFNDATGHFSLWDGSRSVHGDYFERSFRVSLWIAE
ncbi:MAG TPA: T6SS effector amidase Tae4 family protein [Polyangiaceae bacterium]|jgi:hypothetical protein|nr:T6SS effector amidase Tae4 family protein [Polyangiaceae bacterium]